MLRYLILALVLAVCMLPTVNVPQAHASDSFYAAACETYSYEYDPGKTPTGFYATATDGCHVAKWTGSIGQGPGSGTVTFKTIGNLYPWDEGYTLPTAAGGVEAVCKQRAAQEANGYFTNYFKVPLGTEVTVKYRCD